jgi:hypothetical protein
MRYTVVSDSLCNFSWWKYDGLILSWLNCRHVRASLTIDFDLKLKSEQVTCGHVNSLQLRGSWRRLTEMMYHFSYWIILFLLSLRHNAGNRVCFEVTQACSFSPDVCLWSLPVFKRFRQRGYQPTQPGGPWCSGASPPVWQGRHYQ